jgi:excisionase family DNA binding protein
MMAAATATAEARLMRPRDVAEMLGKSVTWVQRKAADGTLPHRKIGRDLRFLRHEIEAWVNTATEH